MTDIISNATPLIAFARIGQLGEIKAVRPLLEAMHEAGIYFS